MQTEKVRKKESLHFPRLDTVLMIEKFIKEHSGEYKRTELWEKLPKKTMYQTYKLVLDYLKQSGKIVFDKEGKVVWIYNPKLVEKYKKEELKIR